MYWTSFTRLQHQMWGQGKTGGYEVKGNQCSLSVVKHDTVWSIHIDSTWCGIIWFTPWCVCYMFFSRVHHVKETDPGRLNFCERAQFWSNNTILIQMQSSNVKVGLQKWTKFRGKWSSKELSWPPPCRINRILCRRRTGRFRSSSAFGEGTQREEEHGEKETERKCLSEKKKA